jgi:flagellar basal-body rod protein FlgF
MSTGLYVMASRMEGLSESLDVTASNLANAATPGFKRTQGKFKSILDATSQPAEAVYEGDRLQLQWPGLGDWQLDLSPGAIRRTGRPLDLAVQGDGFFVLDTPAGERFTRKGRMQLTAEGELIHGSGNRLVADSGTLRIPAEADEVTVSADGSVSTGEQSLGRLRIVELPEPELLRPEGMGIYRNDGAPAESAIDSRVIQGAVEESNVNPVQEMVAMIKIMRTYEAGSRLLKRLDSLDHQLIQTAA